MPLSMAKAGETNYIRKITGKDEVRNHLAKLGFIVGEKITVISKLDGSMIISVKDCRIALDHSIVNRILV